MSPDASDVIVRATLREAAAEAARIIVDVATDAVAQRGRFAIALAGGETPRTLYALLAGPYRDAIAWEYTMVGFGDERCVPPHNPNSNFRMAWSALLGNVPVPEERIHRIAGELGPDAAARDYDERLHGVFVDAANAPTFDVVLLGVGTDGHTASLFPGDGALEERQRWAAPAVGPPDAKVRDRVTLTFAMLNRARVALFHSAGAEKRDVLSRILSGSAADLPAARVRGVERTVWVLDRAASP